MDRTNVEEGAQETKAAGKAVVDVEGGASTEAEGRVSVVRLFRYADGVDWALYAVGSVAAVANGMTMPAFSILFGELLDSFNPADGTPVNIMSDIERLAVIVAIVAFAAFVLSYIEIASFTIAGERQARVLRDRYFAALLRQEIGWFDGLTSEALVTKVADETRTVKDGLGDKLGLGLRFMSTFVGGFVIAFIKGWQLTLVLLGMTPLIMAAGAAMMAMMAKLEGQAAKVYAAAGAVALEHLAGVRTVQAFGGQAAAIRKYVSQLNVTFRAAVKKGFVVGGGMGFTWLVVFGTHGVAFWFGSKLIADDRDDALSALLDAGCPAVADFDVTCSSEYLATYNGTCADMCNSRVLPCLEGDGCYSGGQVVLVFFAVIIGAMAIGEASPTAVAVSKAQVAGYNMFAVIDRRVAIGEGVGPCRPVGKADVAGGVRFRGVHFAYPTRPERPVLAALNLTVEAGSTVALVGRSGSGKSTIVALLQRFYNVTSGSITLDGCGELAELSPAAVRATMGLVGQQPVLFATTIRDNIRMGAPRATDAEVEAAARQANAYDFIMAFEDGFDTMVGERGAALSGGQKQRIAIARALVRKPKILLLDEATSALDSVSERAVQAALDAIMADKSHTTVVIAHRLSTIKGADKIVVLEHGRVIEQGRHEDLMAIDGGTYRDLVEAQATGRDGSLRDEAVGAPSGDGDVSTGDGGKVDEAQGAALSQDGHASTTKTDAASSRKADGERSVDVSVGRVLRLSSPQWVWIVVGLLASVVNGAVWPMFALVWSEMVTLFFEPVAADMRDGAVVWALLFVAIGVAAFVAALLQFGSFGVVGSHLERRLRRMTFHAMLHKDMAFHDQEENSTGVLATQLATDATLVNGMASERMAIMSQNVVSVVVGLGIAFSATWRLSLLLLACFPVLALAGELQMLEWTGATSSAAKSLEAAGQVVQESVHGIRTVVSFGLQDRLCDEYRARLVQPQRSGIKGGHLTGLGFGFSQLVMMGAYSVAFYVGGVWVRDGYITFNDMMTCLMSVMMTAMALGQANSMAPDAAKATTAVRNIFTTLDTAPGIKCEAGSGGRQLAAVRGHILLRDVVFRYPTRAGRVLNQLTLDVPAGSTVALVGGSGSGKSTVVQLVQRMYDPVQGKVTLDGVDVSALDCAWLRRQIGVVSQEPTLFNGTVAENILYGLVADGDDGTNNLGTDVGVQLLSSEGRVVGSQLVPQRIVQAAQDANAHDFIRSMPHGYETRIKPDTVSGGQRQRIAIARAILRDPPVLLLDEATSALDNRSEQVVQDALDRLVHAKRRTTIVVAHRLSTIRNSDHIVVMGSGGILEQGTHAFLVSDAAPVGKYRRMWQQQQLVARPST